MAISTEEALSSWGSLYNVVNAIPELRTYLDQGLQGGWTPQRLSAAISSSPWYMQHGDTVRNLIQLQTTDPASYTQNIANATRLVTLKAQQLGRSLTQAQAQALAYRTLVENASWDDQVLTQLVSGNSGIAAGENGAYLGQAAQLYDHMTQVAQNYGVGYTKGWLDQYVTQVELGANSLDGFEAVIRARAKAAYPQFANQIDAGMTIRDIADPYISTYAQTLEVPETQVTLNDTYIKKALAQTGQDGQTQTSMPLWQFQRLLKDDPRYDRTQQAKDDAFSTLRKIGSDWGFVGGGSA